MMLLMPLRNHDSLKLSSPIVVGPGVMRPLRPPNGDYNAASLRSQLEMQLAAPVVQLFIESAITRASRAGGSWTIFLVADIFYRDCGVQLDFSRNLLEEQPTKAALRRHITSSIVDEIGWMEKN